MSEDRRAKFKGKDSLVRSADLKRGIQDARNKKNRERALDSKRTLFSDNNSDSPNILHAMQGLQVLKEHQQVLASNENQTIECLVVIFRWMSNPNSELLPLLSEGLVQVLEQCLLVPNDGIQLNAAKCITCIASGDHSQTSLLFAIIPSILQLLQSPSSTTDIKTQLCWALGNIAVDCNQCKVNLTKHHCPQVVISLLLHYLAEMQAISNSQSFYNQYSSLINVVANLLWTLTNMVRGNIDVPFFLELSDAQILQLLSLYNIEDEAISPMIRWLFTILSSKEQLLFDRLLSLGLYDLVIKGLAACIHLSDVHVVNSQDSNTSCSVGIDRDEEGLLALIRCLGNLCAGSEALAVNSFTCQLVVPRLVSCLDNDIYSKYVSKEALRTLSYLLHGTNVESQVQYFQPYAREFMRHFHRYMVCEESEVQEASLIAIESIHPPLSLAYYENNTADCRADLHSMLKLILNPHISSIICQIAVLQLWREWVRFNTSFISELLSEIDALESLENLQYISEEKRVISTSKDIIDIVYKYLEEQEQEQETVAPVVQSNVFAFGLNPSDTGGVMRGAGRGQQAIVPAWMQQS